ncbi:hypothetical protein CHS0354_033701 [Potamilus streckersoni]|uniref:RNA helicase n=1 Tax=Potamilus streckersoni TaxID=2493646 RepID=A0AAE0S264_9BIVA|nr:hypothetical protein CHS0354_033701 [Potamilus streckersoni]
MTNGQIPKKMRLGSNEDDFYQRLQQQRRSLPIHPARGRLIHEVQRHSSVIVIGETGSGKTTQIPQYLYEAGLHRNAVIAVTQPRRVAAITISKRVAQEKKTELGHLVGYCVRFEDVTTDSTKLKYMTDGMLLREAILDPLLKRYSVVILDEAHERTIHTDVLFGVVKAAQRQRAEQGLKHIKIVVMSATMDVDHFSKYFNNAPVLYLEGRQYPIQVFYSVEHQTDYMFASLVTLFQIHKKEPAQKDVLIFLTGQEEIESAVKSIRDIAKEITGAPNLVVYPLYSSLPSFAQMRVFQPTPEGCRKVVVATNIAETSVTIQGIKFVIDSGMVKAKVYNPNSGLDLLKVVRVAKDQALQRTGRAGREAPGICYRLYTEDEFETFSNTTVPEIQRCNLASVVLQLLAMHITDVAAFDFMDKPSPEAVKKALEQLELLSAVEKRERYKLTPLGRQMAAFPLDPRLSKVILTAKDFQCLEEILTIVSVLSVDSVLFTPPNKQWCHENFIDMRNMKTAQEVRRQLKEICERQELPIQSCGRDTVPIRKCLAAGFFMSAAELQREGEYVTLSTRKVVSIHPSSVLFRCKPGYVLYNELTQTSKCYMRDLCVIDAEWLYDTAPNYFRNKKPGR